jgi:hypothetical protein
LLIFALDQNDVDEAATSLSSVFTSGANNCLRSTIKNRSKRTSLKKVNRINKQKRWFDKDCTTLPRKTCARLLQKNHFDRNCRDKYYVALKAYKGNTMYINSVVDNIVNASKSNPKIFWNSFKSLRFDTDISDSSSYITSEDWLHHFKYLNDSSEIIRQLKTLRMFSMN